VPALSGGVEAEVGEGVMLPIMIGVATIVLAVFGLVGVPGLFGVIETPGSSVGSGGSSEDEATADSSGEGSVEIPGSVPRKMYLKGVSVAVTVTAARAVL